MTQTPSILAIIPARGGSKRVPGKNLKTVGGKSLLGWTIQAAQAAHTISRVVVSSEDPEVISAAIAAGAEVPFIRPSKLATDTADSRDVVKHALESVGEHFDMFVLLQPTSPLREAGDIDAAVRFCLDKGAPACVSVTTTDKPPAWTYRISTEGEVEPLFPENATTNHDENVVLNGAIYLAQTDWFRHNQVFISPETVGYVMPRERSIDIDEPLDFVLAEALFAASQATAADSPTGARSAALAQ